MSELKNPNSSDCDVSAVVVNYHCAADTVACVNSMLVDMPNVEVVVVDNRVVGWSTGAKVGDCRGEAERCGRGRWSG